MYTFNPLIVFVPLVGKNGAVFAFKCFQMLEGAFVLKTRVSCSSYLQLTPVQKMLKYMQIIIITLSLCDF